MSARLALAIFRCGISTSDADVEVDGVVESTAAPAEEVGEAAVLPSAFALDVEVGLSAMRFRVLNGFAHCTLRVPGCHQYVLPVVAWVVFYA